MAFLKIVALFAVMLLGFLQVRQEKRVVKWLSLGLCALVFIIGTVDVIVSTKAQDQFEAEAYRDATRIAWKDTQADIHIINDFESVSKGAQQVVFKIIPLNLNKVGNIQINSILKKSSPDNYLDEADAKNLWLALAEPDGGIEVSKENALGIEHISFYENELKKTWNGADSVQKVEYEPRVGSRYTSLYDLNNTILLARFCAGINGPAFLDRVDLHLRSKAGLSTFSFMSKQVKDNAVVTSPVRYVGIVMHDHDGV